LINIQLDEKMPKYDYFVACDFKIPDKDDLINIFKVAFEGTSMKSYYTDLEVRTNGKHIFNKIEEMIQSTEFGIYEISTNNQNVSLELGLSKGAKKRLYMLAKKGSFIPSDLQGMDRIEYDDYSQLSSL
jgi:predicted nucleotide-binding protein